MASNRRRCAAGMFQIAKTYMGVKESQTLTLMHADGLDFIRPEFKTSAPAAQSYDVIILDVAVPAQVLHFHCIALPRSMAWHALIGSKRMSGAYRLGQWIRYSTLCYYLLVLSTTVLSPAGCKTLAARKTDMVSVLRSAVCCTLTRIHRGACVRCRRVPQDRRCCLQRQRFWDTGSWAMQCGGACDPMACW